MAKETENESFSSKKKRYVSVACINCQRRRRRCDGGHPCEYCLATGKECTYKVEEDKRRKTYTSSKIQRIENENKILKSLLEKYLDKEAITDPNYLNYLTSDVGTSDFPESEYVESLPENESIEDSYNKKIILTSMEIQNDTNKNFSRAVQDLTEMVWKLQIGPSNRTKFVGPTSNRITKLTESELELNENSTPNSAGSLFVSGSCHLECGENGPHILSQSDFLKKLMNIYVENFVKYNLALRDCNLNSLLADYLSDENQKSIDEVSVLFLHTVFAYSFNILPSDDPNKTLLGTGNQFLTEVESKLLIVLNKFTDMEWSSQQYIFFILMTLTSLYLGNNDECKAWSYNSLLGAQAIHLGLHVTSTIKTSIPVSLRNEIAIDNIVQERTILFWTCFLYDRLSTTIFGRNCVINNRRVLTDFFVSNDQGDEEMILFQYDTKLWYIFEKYVDEIYSFHYDEYDSSKKLILLVSALRKYSGCYNELFDTLPLRTSSLNTLSLQSLLFHLKYHVCLLFIYRPYIQMKDYSSAILEKCFNAMNRCVMFVRAIEHNIKYYEYPFYYGYLLSSILLFMELLFTIEHFKTQSLIKAFTEILNSLKRASRLWSSVHIYIETLVQRANLWKLDEKIIDEFFTPIMERADIDDTSSNIFEYNFDNKLETSELINVNDSINKVFCLDEDYSKFMEAAQFLNFET